MMKRLLLVVTALLTIHSGALAQDVITRLIGASPFQDSLWVFDTTGMILNNSSISHRFAPAPSSGGSITGINGIAKDPSTGIIYTINKQSGVSGRTLGTLNLQTGVVTIIGNLGDNFSSITFNGNNTLLGVTGDGATVPETCYRIDKTNASKTLLRALGNGADGEIISYNPTDNMVYHWSGNGTIVYEKFDTSGVTVTNIPIIGTTSGETFGSVYIGNNKFLNSNISSGFNIWDVNGTVSPGVGSMPDDLRGLAFITCTRQISGNDNFCTGGSTALSVGTAMSYQWYKDGSAIAGETTSAYIATAPGVYNCIVKDVCGTDSVSTGITVQENPLPNVNLSGSASYCVGTPITLTGSSGGTSQWYLNGVMISGETSNTISVSAPGVYNMTKTNLNGCTDSAAVGITITELPLPTVTLDASTYSACQNEGMVTLTESPAGGTFTGSTGNQFDPSAAVVGLNTVIYSYTDANSCTSTDTIQIDVLLAPTADITPSASYVCADEAPITFNGSPAGGTFIPGNIADPAVLGAGSFTFDYLFVDANGCSDTAYASVLVNALPTVSLTAPATDVCIYDGLITLTGSPSGGTYSGTGVSGNSFDPTVAGVGSASAGYSYTDGNGCTNTDNFNFIVDSCLSVNETLLTNITVYPNPANAEVIVDLGDNSGATVALVDMAGKRVNAPVIAEMKRARLTVAQLENGTYWLIVTTVEGQFRQKVVVIH